MTSGREGRGRRTRTALARFPMWAAAVLSAAAGLAGAVVLPAPATGTEPVPFSEYQVKAAFIYNFAKFVDWPESAFRGPEVPLSVCLLGSDPFGEVLDSALRDKTVHDRRLEISRFRSVREMRSCNILFVSSSESGHLEEILESLWGSPVLTIGEEPRFGRLGGVITFVIDQSRVRFEINVGAAERAGLRISSKLLGLARSVSGGDQGRAR